MPHTASLVFFYFGEQSYLTALAQETVPLHRAFEGYDRQVLLHHELTAGPFELSQKAEKAADVVDIPTRENLAAQLNDLGRAGYVVDLFIFSHGWNNKFRVSAGSYGDNTSVSQAYLESHVDPLKLRAVWQCNCYGASMNDCWRNLGARVTAGSRFVNFYPTRFKGFIKRWNDGMRFGASVSQSDTKAVHTPVQIYLTADALARAGEWGGNPFRAAGVLGNNSAAEDYFRACWLGDDWQPNKSGKQNMNFASRMLFQGDRTVTKQTVW